MAARSYRHDGVDHPLVEADYDTAFKVWKTDRKKAVIGDPHGCIEALGLRRLPNVAFAYVGSGHDAYVGFKNKKSPTGILVNHFVIPSAAAKVRDEFEVKGSPETQIIMLKAPTSGLTLSHRRTANKKWREDVKKGKAVKARGPNKSRRLFRIGVPPRPRAKIIENDTITIKPSDGN